MCIQARHAARRARDRRSRGRSSRWSLARRSCCRSACSPGRGAGELAALAGGRRRASAASTSSSRGSACCPGCRWTAAGSSGRSPGRGPSDRDRAGAVTARIGRLPGLDDDRRRRSRWRSPTSPRRACWSSRLGLAAPRPAPGARPAARARAAAPRRHGARGDGGATSPSRRRPTSPSTRSRTGSRARTACRRCPVVDGRARARASSARRRLQRLGRAPVRARRARPRSCVAAARRRSSRPTTPCGTRVDADERGSASTGSPWRSTGRLAGMVTRESDRSDARPRRRAAADAARRGGRRA